MTQNKQRGPAWCTGPNPLHHQMYVQFGYNRVSAKLRGETWLLTWPQWRDTWIHHWHQRGRSAQDLCLVRKDLQKPWCESNIELITRREHGKRVRKMYK